MTLPALTPNQRHEAAQRLFLIIEKVKRGQNQPKGNGRKFYAELETKLSLELKACWKAEYTDALTEIFKFLPKEATQEAAELLERELLNALGPAFGASPGVRRQMKKYIEAAYSSAKQEWTLETVKDKDSPLLSLPDRRAIEVLTRHNCFWLGEHYGEHIGPKIAELTRQALNAGLGRKALAEELKKELGGVAPKDYKYWDVASSAAIVRARSFGTISGMEEAGIAEYEILAMGDERMCPICGEMNGRVFSVAETRGVINSVLKLDDPKAFKDAMPWQTKPATGMTSSKLTRSGQSLPPFHGRCRCALIMADTTIEASSENNETPQSAGASVEPTAPISQSPLDPPNINVPKGEPMTPSAAIDGVNPKYDENAQKGTPEYAYSVNCQRCVPAYELRRRGYNVTAKPKPAGIDPIYSNSRDGTNVWVDENGNPLQRTRANSQRALERALKSYPDGARFAVGAHWKVGRGEPEQAHVFSAEKMSGLIFFFDSQNGDRDVSRYFQRLKGRTISYSRIDNAKFNPNINIYDVIEDVTA